MFGILIRRFTFYCRNNSHFSGLITPANQLILLKSGVLEMCMLRAAFVLDSPYRSLRAKPSLLPIVHLSDIGTLLFPPIYENLLEFVQNLQSVLGEDEQVFMMLAMISVFNPDRPELQDRPLINRIRSDYQILLKGYLKRQYGPNKSPEIFATGMSRVIELCKLCHAINNYNLLLGIYTYLMEYHN